MRVFMRSIVIAAGMASAIVPALAAPGPVRSSIPAPEQPGTAAAAAAITRLIGPRAALFDLRLIARPESWYAVHATGGRARIEGSSPVALVRGAYAYLNRAGLASVSWEGDRVAVPTRLPDTVIGRTASPFRHRAYLNTCTYGYTTPFWTWARWEREIDWMAANGVDMPLALEGQEYVWRALWREAGLDDAAIAGHFSGPAFLPWERMGNIEGYRAPLAAGWIEKKHRLQLRILARMKALGMKPVLPAFAGYVPKAFADRHPEARIYRMRQWEGFPPTYWLDPADPLFARLAARFIALYTRTYGVGGYYLADAFNEMVPPIAEDGSDARDASYGDATANTAAVKVAAIPPVVRDRRLAAYGERLYRSIADAAPGATWVMQGWLFGADKTFWSPPAIAAFLSKVPDDRMLLLDIGNDRYPGVWRDTRAFEGKNWVYGYVHNYGGSNPVYGDLDFYRSDMAAVQANAGKGRLAGFGMFPEGLHSNAVVYAYAYDLAWGAGAESTGAWIARYLRARYGRTTPALLTAWADIVAGAYSTKYWTPRWWEQEAGAYLLFKRPTARITTFAGPPGDPARLARGIDRLLAASDGFDREPLFRRDLTDLVRHLATMKADRQLQAAVTAYAAGDVMAGDQATAAMTALAMATDRLVGGQQESLASWIGDARAYGDTPAERDAYEGNARAQVTIWGGQGHLSDYASKAWAGLYAGYYLPRWTMFLRAMRTAALAGQPFDEAATVAQIRRWETAWVARRDVSAAPAPIDPVAQARQLAAMAAQ
ncbi:alpha-N-acetylglucosaminidase [Sphingomonas sp. BT553]|uniref:Alpha-N-acetylglucosaminidase n=2 Tax=Sphingomonas mollis TaxID=2795726 RepID=A0ABS0XM22_9SPHN|nr:alpha-N-acetylglucosaminidase [Sphingomonas sp. BT553]